MRQGALRISEVGLRGVVGPGLTATHVLEFAAAFGSFLERGHPVVLGRDPRASGSMLREGVVASLLACGHEVIDLGIVSTPVVQHAIAQRGAAGGIALSASHNGSEWNALRFLGAGGRYLSTAQAGELLDIYHLHRFDFCEWNGLGKLTIADTAIDAYIDDLAEAFDLAAVKQRKVVVDCCNGTSALILRRMNERYDCGFILINERVEGVAFAHEPATSAAIAELQLAPLMRPLGADVGFLFDVDSDRVAMADANGRGISEELMLPLLADYLLPKSKGKLVITNLSTTGLVEEIAGRHGGAVLRVPVGRQAAMDALNGYPPEQIAIAGEGTGAVMMPRFRFVYDGIASMLAVLGMMIEWNASLASILDGFPRYSILKGQAPVVSPRVPRLLTELREQYSDGAADSSDGLRMTWPDRWFHVRVSQTEPVIRVICERKGDAPKELFDALMDRVRALS